MTPEEIYKEALKKIALLQEDQRLFGGVHSKLILQAEELAESAIRRGEACQNSATS